MTRRDAGNTAFLRRKKHFVILLPVAARLLSRSAGWFFSWRLMTFSMNRHRLKYLELALSIMSAHSEINRLLSNSVTIKLTTCFMDDNYGARSIA